MPKKSTASSTASVPDICFFADVFRDSAIPTLIMTPDSRVLFWNAAMERLFGWSAEEVLGRSLPLVPPERWEEHLQLRQRTADGKAYSRHRIVRRDKAGRPVEVSLSTWPIRGADGHVIAFVAIYVEVQTEELRFRRSLAEKQLEEIERLYATAPIGLCFLDRDLRFIRVNERLAQIDGLAAEAHVGRRLIESGAGSRRIHGGHLPRGNGDGCAVEGA
jgi:PAS domain S-box-containing protein